MSGAGEDPVGDPVNDPSEDPIEHPGKDPGERLGENLGGDSGKDSGEEPMCVELSAVPPGLNDFRPRLGSENSTFRTQCGLPRGTKRVATSPPRDTDDFGLDPLPLTEQEIKDIKTSLLGFDYSFASINACSRESTNRKNQMEEVISAYRNAVYTLADAYAKLMTERNIMAKMWSMMKTTGKVQESAVSVGIVEAVRESTGATVRCVLEEERTKELEKVKIMATEVAAALGSRVEEGIRKAVEPLVESGREIGIPVRTYASMARTSGSSAVTQLARGSGNYVLGADKGKLQTLEITPGTGMADKFADAQATCDAVLGSIKPGEAGIRIDKLIKGRNKSVRIVADHREIDKLRPLLGGIGMDVKRVDKLSPRLMIRDIPTGISRDQLIEVLVKQNLDGANKDGIKLVYWNPAKDRRSAGAVIEVSPEIRNELLSRGRVYLGWSSCRVADHLRILQCFKCLSFGHVAKNCQAATDTCGHCSGAHETRACPKTGERKCHNCTKEKLVEVNHSALDSSACPILQRKLNERSRMIQY